MKARKSIPLAALLFAAGFGLGYLLIPAPSRHGEDGTASPEGRSSEGTTASSTVDRPASEWKPQLGAVPRFTDVTGPSGIRFRHENGLAGDYQYLEIMGAGVGIFDHDGDGDLDIYFVNGNKLFEKASPTITNRLYRNDGNLRFTDVTDVARVGHAGYGQGCCVGDYDGDGDPDLYVTNYGRNVLYANDGAGVFEDVTARAGLEDPGWGQSCSFLDFDGDGWLDLYVQNYLSDESAKVGGSYIYIGNQKTLDYPSPLGFPGAADHLYRNQGDGTFRDVTEEAGVLRPGGKGMGVACADFDGDARVDVFVANDSAENFLFLNRGNGTFQEVGLVAGVAFNESGVPEASMGVDVGDVDRDGRLDLIVPCLRRQFFTLYRNTGNGFADESVPRGLARATARATGFNANFLDYDHDADIDIFFTNGGVRRNESAPANASYEEEYGIPDLLLANDGRGRFTDVSSHAGPYFERAHIGRGSAVGDLDGDGDLDIVVCNLAGEAVLLRNDTEGGHWLILDLTTDDGQRQFPGTQVQIEAAGQRQRVYIHGGVSYLSQSDRRPHFGLGDATVVDRLQIRWPDGTTQLLENVPADQVLRLSQ